MTFQPSMLVAALAALALAQAASADEEEVMARYAAYNAVVAEGRYDDAAVEGEAAWRAAEAEWGARQETAVLAFNLCRLLLMLDRREEAAEPAARALALLDQGLAQDSISRSEAALLVRIAGFDVDKASVEELDALEANLAAHAPQDYQGSLIAWTTWTHLLEAPAKQRPMAESLRHGRAPSALDDRGSCPFAGPDRADGRQSRLRDRQAEGGGAPRASRDRGLSASAA